MRCVILHMILMGLLSGCLASQPSHTDDICKIFKSRPKWYWASQRVQQKWGVPIPVQMAIVHQESSFKADARPPRRWILGVIPWTRPSNAYGYSQALESTWRNYKKATGHWSADRDEFEDAIDFVGWYARTAHNKAGIKLNDTYTLYLAYHEGVGGYQRKTYQNKPWLVQVARKVAFRAVAYHQQLERCAARLERKPWYRFW